jgi:hypothetical protein
LVAIGSLEVVTYAEYGKCYVASSADFMLLVFGVYQSMVYMIVLQAKIQCFVSLFGFIFVIQTQIGKFPNVEFEGGC